MNSVRSSRRNANSSSFGSFTLTTICCDQASAAVGTMSAPAATKSASVIDAPSPAPVSTQTWMPWRSSSRTPSGVIATRCSAVLTSFGTPTDRIAGVMT